MRIGNIDGRAVVLTGSTGAQRAVDIAEASGGRFGPDPRGVFEDWSEFAQWATKAEFGPGRAVDADDLGAPIPDPRQIFAIGLNYRDHADEAKLDPPDDLVVFTKFVPSLAEPNATVALPSDTVDYETELVVIVGRELHKATPEEARSSIAGYAVGQDYSERTVQLRGPAPQFSLGKSFPGFAPFGPAVVTGDELADPDALRITARITGPTAEPHGGSWTVQDGTTADLIFSVERILADLSQIVRLYPGDLVFTGTPAGVGAARGIFLRPGDVLESTIEGVGTITNTFVAS